jgi:hypothetical protein
LDAFAQQAIFRHRKAVAFRQGQNKVVSVESFHDVFGGVNRV